MLSHLLASISNVEKQSNHTVFDYTSYFHWLGKISEDAAVTHLQIEADMQMYHIRMSRDVNFRPLDSTGVLQNPKPLRYLKRLLAKEGDSVVQDIIRRPSWLNEAPHDALRNASLFEKAFSGSMHFTYIARDPEDLIADWIRRGFGRRIGTDPREFQLTYRIAENVFPLFSIGNEGVYNRLSELEKVAMFIAFCAEQNLRGLQEVSTVWTSREFSFVTFKQLVEEPHQIVERIATKISEKIDARSLSKQFKSESIPRRYNPKTLEQLTGFSKECLERANIADREINQLARKMDNL